MDQRPFGIDLRRVIQGRLVQQRTLQCCAGENGAFQLRAA